MVALAGGATDGADRLYLFEKAIFIDSGLDLLSMTLLLSGAELAAMSTAEIAVLAGNGIRGRIDATDNTLSLTVAQFKALGPWC